MMLMRAEEIVCLFFCAKEKIFCIEFATCLQNLMYWPFKGGADISWQMLGENISNKKVGSKNELKGWTTFAQIRNIHLIPEFL